MFFFPIGILWWIEKRGEKTAFIFKQIFCDFTVTFGQFKGVTNWEIHIFWHVRGHCTIKTMPLLKPLWKLRNKLVSDFVKLWQNVIVQRKTYSSFYQEGQKETVGGKAYLRSNDFWVHPLLVGASPSNVSLYQSQGILFRLSPLWWMRMNSRPENSHYNSLPQSPLFQLLFQTKLNVVPSHVKGPK